ncbi:MAG: right-handed parallel beta-helix repeat-containing protein [Thermoanaerobaculia bacterium]
MRGWKSFAVAVSLVASSLAISTTASAASLYVSLSGNNANPGTLAAPFRTLTWAGVKAQPGDVVYVRGGVYNETVNIISKGTATAPILFTSYAGEKAIFDGTGLNTTVLFSLSETEYVTASGFEVRNASYIAVSGWMTRHTSFVNNVVHDAVRNGIYFGYDSPGMSSDAVIEGNQVYNCVKENSAHAMQGGWASTVSIHHTERARVEGNKIWNNDGEAIAVILSNNVTVTGNEAFDNYSQGVYLDNSSYNVVDGNLIYSTGNTRYFRDGYPGMGIAIANEFYDYSNPSTDNKIVNNIIINTRWGFLYGNFEAGGGLKNTVIANNTFYKSSTALIDIWQDTHSNSVVENNIFYQVGGAEVAGLQGSGVTFRNNQWYGGSPSGVTAGAGDVYGNPAFVNAGGLKAADYKLTAASTALGKALDLSTVVKSDFFGTARIAPFDMGAHQFSSGASVDSQAPTAPANLRPVSGAATRVDLAWNAATDNVGVTGYIIKRNGTTLTTVSGTTWSDTAVVAGTKYSYQIFARDAAGNRSAGSNTLDVAWDESHAEIDSEAPTAPGALSTGIITTNSIELWWQPSQDNVAVIAYKVFRDGVFYMATEVPSFTDSGLTAGTGYRYFVVAVDAAGNLSDRTVSLTVKTKPAGRTRAVGR